MRSPLPAIDGGDEIEQWLIGPSSAWLLNGFGSISISGVVIARCVSEFSFKIEEEEEEETPFGVCVFRLTEGNYTRVEYWLELKRGGGDKLESWLVWSTRVQIEKKRRESKANREGGERERHH